MRKLNHLTQLLYQKTHRNESKQIQQIHAKGLFIPELITILVPVMGQGTVTSNATHSSEFLSTGSSLGNKNNFNLKQLCLVMGYMDQDLYSML